MSDSTVLMSTDMEISRSFSTDHVNTENSSTISFRVVYDTYNSLISFLTCYDDKYFILKSSFVDIFESEISKNIPNNVKTFFCNDPNAFMEILKLEKLQFVKVSEEDSYKDSEDNSEANSEDNSEANSEDNCGLRSFIRIDIPLAIGSNTYQFNIILKEAKSIEEQNIVFDTKVKFLEQVVENQNDHIQEQQNTIQKLEHKVKVYANNFATLQKQQTLFRHDINSSMKALMGKIDNFDDFNNSNRIAACISATQRRVLSFDVSGLQPYRVACYFVDYNTSRRRQNVQISIDRDKNKEQVYGDHLLRIEGKEFHDGIWIVWEVPFTGRLNLSIECIEGPNWVLSALLLDKSPPTKTIAQHFPVVIQKDTVTKGDWKGKYGSCGGILFGKTNIEIAGFLEPVCLQQYDVPFDCGYVWTYETSDTRAMQRPLMN